MDTRAKGAPRARTREATSAVGGVSAGDASRVVDGTEQDSAAESAKGSASPRAPSVHGVEVRELMLLMRQGEQGWLLTGNAGNHEFVRVFYVDDGKGKGPQYRVRDGFARFGASELLHAALDDGGVTLSWSCGRKTRIPQSYYQYTYLS